MSRREGPWAVAAKRYAMPHLPGQWLAVGRALIMQPVGLIARGVAAQRFSVVTVLHPLYLPLEYLDTGWILAHNAQMPGLFKSFRKAPDGEVYMTELAEAIRENLLPFFEDFGSLEGFLSWCQSVNSPSGFEDPNILMWQAATAIILRKDDVAIHALDLIQHIAETDSSEPDSPWLPPLANQAASLAARVKASAESARDHLLAGVSEQRRRRGLPDAEEMP
jgi:hypothetical protein